MESQATITYNRIIGPEYISILVKYADKHLLPKPEFTIIQSAPLYKATLTLRDWLNNEPEAVFTSNYVNSKSVAKINVAELGINYLKEASEDEGIVWSDLDFDYVGIMHRWTQVNGIDPPVYEIEEAATKSKSGTVEFIATLLLRIQDQPYEFRAPFAAPSKAKAKMVAAYFAFTTFSEYERIDDDVNE
ncbi:hypothetical protein HK098_003963 [Nowakowskiella sp. JEL0407]|nr:hypothetical protein HK098_003963 [Nowakowskiella sp. JEL0407]